MQGSGKPPVAQFDVVSASQDCQSIYVYAHDSFNIGRDPISCRYTFDDLCISKKHVKIHCVVFEADEEVLVSVYAEDTSTNGTLLWTAHGADSQLPSGMIRLRKYKTGACLLHDGDQLSFASITLTYRDLMSTDYSDDEEVNVERDIMFERYIVSKHRVGKGGQGSVYVAVEAKTKHQLACKRVDLRHTKWDGNPNREQRNVNLKNEKLDKIMREFQVLRCLSHPNIITLEKVFWSSSSIYIFQQLYTSGDLFSYVEGKGGKLDGPETALIIRQILKAVEYMHSQGIVHRDLKPDNILMTSLEDGARIVISDFGSARFLPLPDHSDTQGTSHSKNRMFSVAGTAEFAAPEIHSKNPVLGKNSGYTEAADMWSIGCIAATTLSGVPFVGKHAQMSENEYNKAVIEFASACNLDVMNSKSYWNSVGNRPKDFIRCLVVLDETKRLSASQALSHPWLASDCYAKAMEHLYQRAIGHWKPTRKKFNLIEPLHSSSPQNSPLKSLADAYSQSQPHTSRLFASPSTAGRPNCPKTPTGRHGHMSTISEKDEEATQDSVTSSEHTGANYIPPATQCTPGNLEGPEAIPDSYEALDEAESMTASEHMQQDGQDRASFCSPWDNSEASLRDSYSSQQESTKSRSRHHTYVEDPEVHSLHEEVTMENVGKLMKASDLAKEVKRRKLAYV